MKAVNTERILDGVARITDRNCKAVVFVNKNNLPSYSRDVTLVFRQIPIHRIVGVYDMFALPEWIEDDLQEMGFIPE